LGILILYDDYSFDLVLTPVVRLQKEFREKMDRASIDETKPAIRSPTEKVDDEDLGQSPMWQGEDEGWELTWPIWHMLPRDERKALAHRHGYNTIGEFEEYMYLQRAVDQTETSQRPYENESIYTKAGPQPIESPPKKAPPRRKSSVGDEGDEDSSGDEEPEISRMASSACTEDLSLEELMAIGGKILRLHDELLHQVFSWLPVDAYGTLARVSPHWKHLTRTESVYRRLCERLYLNQSKRRQLHVSHFRNSYRTMLEERPRVRAAGGCYVLKYSSVKKIQRDMWTEVSVLFISWIILFVVPCKEQRG
jgi:F-box protein 9